MRELLDARIASIRSHAEPILPEDFSHAAVPANRNSAPLLLHAAGAIDLSKEQWERIESIISDDPSPADLAFAGDLFRRNRPVFDEISTAHRLGEVDWRIQWAHPALDTSLSHLQQLRQLANLLTYAAWTHHHLGEDATALKNLSDLLFLSRIADDPGPIVAHLVDLGITAVASARTREIALTLHIDNDEMRQQAQSLIRKFLAEDARQAAINRAWQTERMSTLDTMMASGAKTFWIRADFDRLALHLMDDFDVLRRASLAANYPAAAAMFPKPGSVESRVEYLRNHLLPSLLLSVKKEFRALAERRVAAVALALRLYAADHAGRLPAALAEMVPVYLPAIPADPFAADGRALGWRAAPRALVYGVGEDGKDDGAAAKADATTDLSEPWKGLDAVFELPRPK